VDIDVLHTRRRWRGYTLATQQASRARSVPRRLVASAPAFREFLRRVVDNLSEIPASLRFLWAVRFGPVRELWIGDSHAVSFNRSGTYATFVIGPQGQVIHRLGARLMWSLARHGFPRSSDRLAALVSHVGRPGQFVPVFVTGEVDVRCHLVDHPDSDYGFVAAYVERCRELGRHLKADGIYLAVPPPPCEWPPEEAAYPVVGSIGERLQAFARLRAALQEAVASHADVRLLDFTDLIEDESGALRREYTDDGCHTNHVAIQLIRERIGARLAPAGAQRTAP
jgi:hypothetical protein